jgi:hypothetical protein
MKRIWEAEKDILLRRQEKGQKNNMFPLKFLSLKIYSINLYRKIREKK